VSARRPPRWLESLVERRLSSDPHSDSTLGDLAEGFAFREERAGRRRAQLWYVRHALSLVVRGSAPAPAERATAGRLERATWVFGSVLRRMRRRPGPTVAVSGVLAVAVGATLAAFSVAVGTYDAAHWWSEEDRAMLVWPEYPFSRGQLDVLRTEGRAFDAIGGVLRQPVVVSLGDRTASTRGVQLSTELFGALRARPVLGRGLSLEDGRPGAEPVVVIGHGLWRTAFGGERAVIGRTVDVNGVRRRVVGVMAGRASQPGPGTELWMPLVLDPRDPDFWPARELSVVGIARRGVAVESARADVRRVLGDLARRFAFFFRPDFGSDATVVSSAERSWGGVALPLLLLMAGTGLLLAVAAIDVGNVVLARSLERATELRVRLAIGASRRQIVQQILAESVVQTGLAALAGAWLGAFLAGRVPALFPFGTPVTALGATDPRLLGFLACITVAASALTAGIPALHFLGASRRSMAPRFARRVAPRALVIAQAALATMLLVSAALLFRTVQRLERLPLGFEPDEVLAVAVAPPTAPLPGASLTLLQARLAERVAAAPSVRATGWISAVPLLDPVLRSPVNREEEPVEVAAAPTAARFVLDTDALTSLGIAVVSGRGFTNGDDAAGAPVVLINESMARALWPERDPVGRRIAVDPHGWTQWITIVGIVEDIRYEDLTFQPRPAFFLPRAQAATSAMSLVVRTTAGSAEMASVVRSALAELAPDVAAGDARPLRSVVRDAQGPARVMTSLLSVLALLAAALGAIGLYAALAGWVARRRSEIGTRLALGAQPHRLAAGVLATGLASTGIGVVIGAVGGAIAGRAIRGLLYGISPLDPLAFAAPAAVLLATGLIAAAVPAWRAAAVPPAEALRAP
jgi:predicted permease